MCHVWDYTFGPDKMNIDPKESKILLTEPPMNPVKNREKMIQVFLLEIQVIIYIKLICSGLKVFSILIISWNLTDGFGLTEVWVKV